MNRRLEVLAVLGIALTCASCGKQTDAETSGSSGVGGTTQSPTSAVASALTAPVDPNATVVTVNGTAITEREVDEQMERRLAVQRLQMPPGMEVSPEQKLMLRSKVVDLMVEMELISGKLAEKQLSVTDAQVTEAIEAIATAQEQSMEELNAELTQHGMSMTDLREQVGLKLQVEALMEADNKDLKVTQAEAKAFYDENPQHFEQSEQVRASHILCGKRGITEEEFPAQMEKIKAAQARLEAGEPFAEVARSVSDCPSSAQGGDLDFFGRGQMDPAFEKAAFETEVGKTTDIVKTSFGYHLIHVTDRKPASKVGFEEVEEKITSFLEQQKKQEVWSNYSEALRDEATITYSASEQGMREALEQAQQQMLQQQFMQQGQ